MMACPRGPDGRGHTVTAIARVLTIGAAVGASVGCPLCQGSCRIPLAA